MSLISCSDGSTHKDPVFAGPSKFFYLHYVGGVAEFVGLRNMFPSQETISAALEKINIQVMPPSMRQWAFRLEMRDFPHPLRDVQCRCEAICVYIETANLPDPKFIIAEALDAV